MNCWHAIRRCSMTYGRTTLISVLSGIVALISVATPANAQPGIWTVTFAASPDHSLQAQGVDLVQRYELVLTPAAGPALAPFDLGKPTITGTVACPPPATGSCPAIVKDVQAYIGGLPVGTYTGIIRTIGPGGQPLSAVGPPFPITVRGPAAAGPPSLSKSGSE